MHSEYMHIDSFKWLMRPNYSDIPYSFHGYTQGKIFCSITEHNPQPPSREQLSSLIFW